MQRRKFASIGRSLGGRKTGGIEQLENRRLLSVAYPGVDALNAAQQPAASITPLHIPAYGAAGRLRGLVSGINPSGFRIAAVIEVNTLFYGKPTLAQPLTRIGQSGFFSVNIVTGGDDQRASEIDLFLVPKLFKGGPIFAEASIPAQLQDAAVASLVIPRLPDLTDQILSVTPSQAAPGALVHVQVQVSDSSNIGVAARAATELSIGGIEVKSQSKLFSLAGGRSTTFVMTGRVPNVPAGPAAVQVIADSSNAIRESNETNNTSTSQMTILGAAVSGVPAIHIDSVPAFGADGNVSGVVSGVDPASYVVAPFIYVDGLGWYTKPTFATPTVPINSDGTFSFDPVSGGEDSRAQIYAVALVPAGAAVPAANGSASIPASLNAVAMDTQSRYARTLSFAGYQWGVKDADLPVGPGPNVFSSQSSDVWVDGSGLHLTLHYHDGQWWSTEVALEQSLGYGQYSFTTTTSQDSLDPNVTFGSFTWDPYGDGATPGNPNREIDIEDGRWGNPSDPTNSQDVVQPHATAGNLHRFTIPSGPLTRVIDWEPNGIDWLTLSGEQDPSNYPASSVVDHLHLAANPSTMQYVPDPGRAEFRFNLWLNNGATAPSDGQPVEVVISNFHFTPSTATT